jgi:hypothetical protein
LLHRIGPKGSCNFTPERPIQNHECYDIDTAPNQPKANRADQMGPVGTYRTGAKDKKRDQTQGQRQNDAVQDLRDADQPNFGMARKQRSVSNTIPLFTASCD